jgi:hypothetical protein
MTTTTNIACAAAAAASEEMNALARDEKGFCQTENRSAIRHICFCKKNDRRRTLLCILALTEDPMGFEQLVFLQFAINNSCRIALLKPSASYCTLLSKVARRQKREILFGHLCVTISCAITFIFF